MRNVHRLQAAIARGLEYAPYADLLWVETSTPDYKEAKEFADAIHAKFPSKMLAYNCSPSFNWKRVMNDKQIASFQVQPLAPRLCCGSAQGVVRVAEPSCLCSC